MSKKRRWPSEDDEDESDDLVRLRVICAGCAQSAPVNDLGLCDECHAKLERDLVRQRDWEYAATTAFLLTDATREALRARVIAEYGEKLELIAPQGRQSGTKLRRESGKRRDHYCRVCGRYRANEKFSRRGHTRHVARIASAISGAQNGGR